MKVKKFDSKEGDARIAIVLTEQEADDLRTLLGIQSGGGRNKDTFLPLYQDLDGLLDSDVDRTDEISKPHSTTIWKSRRRP